MCLTVSRVKCVLTTNGNLLLSAEQTSVTPYRLPRNEFSMYSFQPPELHFAALLKIYAGT